MFARANTLAYYSSKKFYKTDLPPSLLLLLLFMFLYLLRPLNLIKTDPSAERKIIIEKNKTFSFE